MMKTKKEFLDWFRSEILPEVKAQFEQDNRIDYPARRESWINLIDSMIQDNELPKKAENWSCPW